MLYFLRTFICLIRNCQKKKQKTKNTKQKKDDHIFAADGRIHCSIDEFMHVVRKHLSPIFQDKPFLFILNMCRKCYGKQSAPSISDTSVSPQYFESEEIESKSSNDDNTDTDESKLNRHCSDVIIYATRKGQGSHYSQFTDVFRETLLNLNENQHSSQCPQKN